MLLLSKDRPRPQTVPLGKDSAIVIRAATSFEIDKASAGAARLMFAIIAGSEAAASVIGMLGEEFAEPDFASQQWREAAIQRLTLLELADLCTESLIGVGIETAAAGEPSKPVAIEGKPDKAQLALLLRDASFARKISGAINARVHDEVAEGNELPVSPDGAAKAGEATAPNASATGFPAPMAAPDKTASAAPK